MFEGRYIFQTIISIIFGIYVRFRGCTPIEPKWIIPQLITDHLSLAVQQDPGPKNGLSMGGSS